MDWEKVLAEVILIVARVVAAFCLPYVVKMIKEKFHNDKINKYVDRAETIVEQCVDYVSQTYVDALKKEGRFDKEAQATAFEMSKDYVLDLIDKNAKEAVIEMFGDFELWVNSMIESSVRNSISNIPINEIAEGVVMEDGN